MPTVQYGTREIQFAHVIDDALKHAYITVDFYEGVTLKSPSISKSKAIEAVYKKGKWVLQKLKLVERIPQGEIISGSRLLYLGKRYYVRVIQDDCIRGASVAFNHSKFKISVNTNVTDRHQAIEKALGNFSREKAKLKIPPRIEKWIQITGLKPSRCSFRKLKKRWGSCTSSNEIIINFDAIKLPFKAIDYIIVHELAHIKHRHHSKDFDKEVATFIPDWKDIDDRLCGMKL